MISTIIEFIIKLLTPVLGWLVEYFDKDDERKRSFYDFVKACEVRRSQIVDLKKALEKQKQELSNMDNKINKSF